MREKGSDLTKDIETEGRPKLLIVTSALYFGGAQKVAYLLASGLAGTFDVTVAYCFDSGRSHAYPDSVRIRRLPSFPPGAGQREKNRVIRAQVRALRALKRELDVDAALSLGKVANWINAMSRGKEKVICSERNNPAKRDPEHMQEIGSIYEAADHVVFQSETEREPSMFVSSFMESMTVSALSASATTVNTGVPSASFLICGMPRVAGVTIHEPAAA